MLREGGLTKAEREMIVVATSGANDCLYCIVAHGAILRVYAKNPLVADQVGVNYRKADITPRQKAMLAFALKVAHEKQRDRRRRFRGAARARLLRRGHLGHRRHRGVLLPVEPDGQPDRHAAERRVLPARARAESEVAAPTCSRPSPGGGRPRVVRDGARPRWLRRAVLLEPREHPLPAVLGVRLAVVVRAGKSAWKPCPASG